MSTNDDREAFVPMVPGSPLTLSGQFVHRFFSYAHLPPHLMEVSKLFHGLAEQVSQLKINGFDSTAEGQRLLALQKLLEAKDAAVRAMLKS